MLKEGWEISIREKRRTGDIDGAKRDLLKLRMSTKYNQYSISDRLTISYGLAYCMYKTENTNLANEYIHELFEIYKNKDIIEVYESDYCKCLWLNVNVNEKSMNKRRKYKDILYVCNYYKRIKRNDLYLISLGNLYDQFKRGDELFQCLKEIVTYFPKTDSSVIENFLENINKLDNNLYIKAKDIVDKLIKLETAN